MTEEQPTIVTSRKPPPPTPPPPKKRAFHDRPLWQKAIIVIVVVWVGAAIYGAVTRSGGTPPGTAARPTPVPVTTRAPVTTPVPQAGGLVTRAEAISQIQSTGFTGQQSNLNDGRERWLGRNHDGAIIELIGPPEALTQVTLSIEASAESGELAGAFLNTFAPGSRPFFSDVMDDAVADGDQDQQQRIGERMVPLGDEALVTISVEEA